MHTRAGWTVNAGDDAFRLCPSNMIDTVIRGRLPRPGMPVISLDFDDVVNVIDGKDAMRCDIRKTARIENGVGGVKDLELNMCSWLLDELRRGLVSGRFDIVWCTSWKGYTQSVLNDLLGFTAIGLPPGYIDWKYRGLSDDGRYGKLNGIGHAYETGEIARAPTVAIDDAFYFLDDLEGVVPLGVPSHVVAPHRGITRGDWSEVMEFMSSVSDGR